MRWKRLDQVRRSAGPVELDLIESFALGVISRRDFVKRAAIVGLSAPLVGVIVGACGGEGDGSTGVALPRPTADGAARPRLTIQSSGTLIVGIQQGDANSGLDPINMLDLGTYNVLAQSFEYLVGPGADVATPIAANALATFWSPNEDGSIWTFRLREGAMWSDGSPVTSADVAATLDRMVVGGAVPAGVVSEGAVERPDDLTAVVNLDNPNGNFPVLMSIYNPQSLITPVDYTNGTTLEERPEGSGAWRLTDYDPATFTSKFVRNENWWGSQPPLDSIELRGFDSMDDQVAAMEVREIDVIQNFAAIGGEELLADSNFVELAPASANHRQVWFNTQLGQFTDVRLRRALAWLLNRPRMVDELWAGRADVANDHPVLSTMPFYDPDAVPQRTRDVEMARQLMSDAGVDSIAASDRDWGHRGDPTTGGDDPAGCGRCRIRVHRQHAAEHRFLW